MCSASPGLTPDIEQQATKAPWDPREDSRIIQIASVCHEANRQYCKTIGDDSQLPWTEAPDWQRGSAVTGVIRILEGGRYGQPDPRASHDSWMEEKLRGGWRYGSTKNAETKEHPSLLPYDALPAAEKAKDHVFGAAAKALLEALGLFDVQEREYFGQELKPTPENYATSALSPRR